MKSFTTAFVLAASIAMTFSSSTAQAGINVGDYEAAGDGLLTIDTETGLEWLDWTESTNISFIDMEGEFGAGGRFEGWRHASEAEVLGLLSKPEINFTITNWGTDSSVMDDAGMSARSLFGYVGSTGSVQGSQFTYGIYTEQHAVYSHDLSSFMIPQVGSLADRTDTFLSAIRGHALVRNSSGGAVPEPTSLVCWLGLGLVGLTRRRRNQ